MKKEKLKLIMTCSACPEQYDVVDTTRGVNVGYIRYRHGSLTVNPYCDDKIDFDTIVHSDNIGGSYDGAFDADKRDEILSTCLDKLVEYYNQE